MGFKCGIVGLPNVGKSTLYNALTAGDIEAANYPFCTIEPNEGIALIDDPRQRAIAQFVKPERILPTHLDVVDIAGLVAGASKGEGLGNQFLSHIRETQAIVHVVRCFDDDNITHVNNRIDPLDDIDTIQTELILADLEQTEKAIATLQKRMKAGQGRDLKQRMEWLQAIHVKLAAGLSARCADLDEEALVLLKSDNLLTLKPMLYIANIDENGADGNAYLAKVREHAASEGAQVLPVCVALEAEISTLDEADKMEFLADAGLEETGLSRITRAGHDLLGLQSYFTAGVKEVRAWTVAKNATAVDAAGVIHTDFARGFIRAEVVAYQDFIDCGGEKGAKDAGKWRLEGKDYIVQDGDIMHFRFNI